MEPRCPIDSLSNELLVMIFKNLHRLYHRTQGALYPCLLVNKRWHALALPILCSTAFLDSYRISKSYDDGSLNSLAARYGPLNFINQNRLSCYTRPHFDSILDIQPALLSNLPLCRRLFLRLLDTNLTAIQYYVLKCSGLRHFHVHVENNVSEEFIQAWEKITEHLLTLNIESMDLHLDLRSQDKSSLLNRKYTDPLLTQRLTRLFVCHHVHAEEITMLLSSSLKLKVFKYMVASIEGVPAPKHFTPAENARFWESLERLELEILSFPAPFVSLKWEGGSATLPPTLLELDVTVHDGASFHLTIALQQLELLRSLAVKRGSNRYPAFEFNLPKGTLLQDIAVNCHTLRRLHLGLFAPMALIRKICHHCQMIESIELPVDFYLEETEFLRDLLRLRKIQTPFTGLLVLPDRARQWAQQLPRLEIIVVNTPHDPVVSNTLDQVRDSVSEGVELFTISPDSRPNREERAKIRDKRKLADRFCSMLRQNPETRCIYLDMEEVRADIGIAM
jgi:hypothetical protein